MRKKLALLTAFFLAAAVSFTLGGSGKSPSSASIEMGKMVSNIDRQRLLQDLERHKRDLAESERAREELRRENETLREKMLEHERRGLQQDAQIRDLQDQINALWGPEANLDRCDEFKQSCRTLAGSCAELFERLSRKCDEKDEEAKAMPRSHHPSNHRPLSGAEGEIPSEEKSTIEEQPHGKNEKET